MDRLDEATLRRACAGLQTRLPEAPALRDIAFVGALRCTLGARTLDSIRMARTLDYLLRSDVVICPDFEIDVINLFHGRDFLAEDTLADLVVTSFVPNFDHKLFPKVDERLLERQRQGTWLRESFFWQTRSPRHTPEAWRTRVGQTRAKLLVCLGGKNEISTGVFAATSYIPVLPTPEFPWQPPYRGWTIEELYGGIDWDVPFKWFSVAAQAEYLEQRPNPKQSPPRTKLATAMIRRSSDA